MAFLKGKTPISYLQELCTRRGITPQYDLLANEGVEHEPVFVFKVTAADYHGTGRGASKRKAKHHAALSILNQMLNLTNGAPTLIDADSELAVEANLKGALEEDEVGTDNHVGELQEFTQRRQLPPPKYEFGDVQGPAHNRDFVCHVTLLKLRQKGEGKSKKQAKRDAAFRLLRMLKSQPALVSSSAVPGMMGKSEEEEEEEGAEDEDEDVLNEVMMMNALSLSQSNCEQISEFYNRLKAEPGSELLSLEDEATSLFSKDHCAILEAVGKQQKFSINYIDIPLDDTISQHYCLVQLNAEPTVVCHGIGDDQMSAHLQAATNALIYLRIMSKPNRD